MSIPLKKKHPFILNITFSICYFLTDYSFYSFFSSHNS